ncbi:hypothetical protein M1D52_04545 [Olivibacter sp. SA151]|uniref:hypothetical protein n=1 Tax=Olivibacter jilunii TaxID=985016 RepID=UPI003F171582
MDRMRNDIFDEEVRKKLDSFEPQVSNKVWSNIAEQLDQQTTGSGARPLQMKRALMRWSIAAMIALTLGLGITYIKQPRKVVYLSAKKEVIKDEGAALPLPVTKSNNGIGKGEKMVHRSVSPARRDLKERIDGRKITVSENRAMTDPDVIMEDTGNRPMIVNEVVSVAVSPGNGRVEQPALQFAFIETPTLKDTKVKSQEKKNFGIGEILNYVVGSVDHGDAKVLSFASDDEGTLKVAVDLKALKVRL